MRVGVNGPMCSARCWPRGSCWDDLWAPDELERKQWFGAVSEQELEKIFADMRKHDFPALEPDSLAVEVRLLRAGVRIVSPWEVK